MIDHDGSVFAVIIDFLDLVVGGDERGVLKIEHLASCLAHEQIFEIKRGGVQGDEGVLSDGAQLEPFCHLVAISSDANDNRCDDDLRLTSLERNNDLLLLSGSESACTNRSDEHMSVSIEPIWPFQE